MSSDHSVSVACFGRGKGVGRCSAGSLIGDGWSRETDACIPPESPSLSVQTPKGSFSAAPEILDWCKVVHQDRTSERIVERIVDETAPHAVKEVVDVAKGVHANKRSSFFCRQNTAERRDRC